MRFISYCWNIGTTSFRVKDLNVKIEEQLTMLSEVQKENPTMSWQELENKYYDKMKELGFIKGSSSAKEKVARQKTSGLVELGLLTQHRMITEVGAALMEMVQKENYQADNIFQINHDSYLYLLQMLKYQTVGGSKLFEVKPFIVLIRLLSELDYLTFEEFTYFLPLCTRTEQADEIMERIRMYRNGKITVDEMINEQILSMENYRECLAFMQEQDMDDLELFAKVEMNRKGSRYSKAYYDLYHLLHEIMQKKQASEEQIKKILEFLMSEYKKNIKTGKVWRDYFSYKRNIELATLKEAVMNTPLIQSDSLPSFQKEFFLLLTRAKWKANLLDYHDLNRRYFALTDLILFRENKVELDLFPKYYFKQISKKLMEIPFLSGKEYMEGMEKNLTLEEISPCFLIDLKDVYESISKDYQMQNHNVEAVNALLQNEKTRQFQHLIETEFREEQLIYLLQCFQKEKADSILSYADWTANLPTIFEYIIAIAWYRISNQNGNLMESMRLSLDANLYPKSHAAGGDADILWKYENHALLLEATLTKSTNQRKSEMEPVSRHIMRYLQETEEEQAYAVFVAPFLNEEVLSDFRNKKTYQYRAKDGTVKQGLNIVALDVEDLIYILSHHICYETLYEIFQTAIYDTKVNDLDWYKKLIREPIRRCH